MNVDVSSGDDDAAARQRGFILLWFGLVYGGLWEGCGLEVR